MGPRMVSIEIRGYPQYIIWLNRISCVATIMCTQTRIPKMSLSENNNKGWSVPMLSHTILVVNMKVGIARQILNLDSIYDDECTDVPHEILKSQYKRQALIYHPDKNTSPDATSKFRDAKDAFDLLEGYYGYADCDDLDMEDLYDSERTFSSSHDGYVKILMSFIRSMVGTERMTEEHSMVFGMIMEKFSNCCETQAIIILRKIDADLLVKIHECLIRIRHVIHFPDTVIDTIHTIITENIRVADAANGLSEHLVLYPTLSDLFDHNVYITHRDKCRIMVPLWCSELVYDSGDGGELTVTCVPIVPQCITIESNNDITVCVQYSISDIWGKTELEILIGDKKKKIVISELKLVAQQAIVFEEQGIPRFNESDIYDVSVISSVVVIVKLTSTLSIATKSQMSASVE